MKKLWVLPVIVTLLAALFGMPAYAAGSASVSISSYTSVQQGKSYTYTISVKISSSMDFIGTIKFSGIFSHDPIYLDYHPSANSSKTLTEKVTFKIPSNAQLGSTGKISVSGQGDYLDDSGNVVEYKASKSLTAKVIAPKPVATASKKPASSHIATASVTPTATPEPSEWDAAVQNASSLQAGGTLSVDVSKSTQLPVSLLSALKDKQGKLTVNLGNYTCAVDGSSLGALPASGSVDLAMTMDKDAALSQACGGADAYQLHFANLGQLPGRFTYTFKADSNKPGDTLYLYYYYEASGVLEGIQSAVVDDSGNVSFSIYHCSSYAVSCNVIDGAAGSLSDTAAARQAAADAQNKQTELETQLKTAQDSAAQMEGRIKDAQDKTAQLESQLKDAEAGAAKAAAAPQAQPEGKYSFSLDVLIAGACVVAMVAVLLTMLVYRIIRGGRKNPDR